MRAYPQGHDSRDLTENVEQLQIWKSMQIIRDKAVAVLNRMSALAEQWKHVTIAGRTHNVAAQTTTMGKRVAMFGEDIVHGLGGLDFPHGPLQRARTEGRRWNPA